MATQAIESNIETATPVNSLSLYMPLFLSGLTVGVVFFLWRKASARWSTWFPILKKGLEWSFIGAGGAAAIYGLLSLGGEGVSAGPGLLALVLGLVLPEVVTRYRGRGQEKEETKRGASMGNDSEVARKIKTSKVPTYLELAEVPIPVSAEPYHFLIAGSTGTGKSVAINTLLQKIRARGDTAIVVDSGGNFVEKHFDAQTDFVFNPYDERCVGWSPTAELQGVWDAQALARSIVPDGVGDSKEWNSYAQTFVGAVLRKLWEQNRLTMRDFLYFVQAAPRSELQELLADTAAAGQLASERTFGSIRTIAGNYVTSYDYLPTDRDKFSVAEMIRAEHSGVLFLTYRDDQLDSLRNLMACLLDVAARTILSLEPNPDRRVWLIIDEFASLGKVQSIEAVATKARKNGGCLVLGVQSVSQLRDRYGDNGAQTILSCLSTWLVLRCSDADTAEYMSKYIGEAEIRRTQKGQSASDSGETQSWNEQSAVQRVVLGSQIQAFPNLHGMLKLAGDYPVCEVDLTIPKLSPQLGGSPFQGRDFRARPLLKLAQASEAKPKPVAPVAAPVAPQAELVEQAQGVIPGYADTTPRPKRPKNLLVEVSRDLKPLSERVVAQAPARKKPAPDAVRQVAQQLEALARQEAAPVKKSAAPAKPMPQPAAEETESAGDTGAPGQGGGRRARKNRGRDRGELDGLLR